MYTHTHTHTYEFMYLLEVLKVLFVMIADTASSTIQAGNKARVNTPIILPARRFGTW